jgi:hypothetical protein
MVGSELIEERHELRAALIWWQSLVARNDFSETPDCPFGDFHGKASL